MFIKLPTEYVDPRTLAPLPQAVLVITDAFFALRAGEVRLQLSVFATPDAAQALRGPISEHSVALSTEEIAAQAPAILLACYEVLRGRPEFNGTTLVP